MQISLADWINIVQTVILLLTGLILVWYTVETARIRKQTSFQNTMLAEQLRIIQSTRQHELAKEIGFIKPYFRFLGGQSSSNRASWTFANKGGSAKKLGAKPLGEFTVSVSPSRFCDSNEQGRANFTASEFTPNVEYPFEISCEDKLGNQHIFKFRLKHQVGVLEEDS
jgi:hypothetical protein